MAAIALVVFMLLYGSLGLAFSPAWSKPERQPVALFFLLLLLTVLTWLFSGAAFFLDRTRLPVFTTLLVVSLLTGMIGTDHKFVVEEKKPAELSLSPSDVIEAWKEKRGKGSQDVIVVATAGGGIRAAAWTAEVMTRLQDGCGAVSNSLVLVSSVSGGSVGTLFVVGPYLGTGEYPSNQHDLDDVRFNARRSSLGAVGWGLAYPDLLRTVPFFGTMLVPQTFDRGWSLENAWARPWKGASLKTPTMRCWRDDVRRGARPAVIFNATSSETGDRFLIASTDTSSDGTQRFFSLFPEGDVEVSTAARLSATFPYVSPLARPSAGPSRKGYHVGDGGYYDNSGLLSAVEWLNQARGELEDFKVLLILIDTKPGPEKDGGSWSWQKQFGGPIETLLHVRTSSQQLRDSIDRDMAHDYLASQKKPVYVMTVNFLFASNEPPPLSWHLTNEQIEQISQSWREKDNQEAWTQVRRELGCSTNPTILQENRTH
jgi:Patatin-like phospholipase